MISAKIGSPMNGEFFASLTMSCGSSAFLELFFL